MCAKFKSVLISNDVASKLFQTYCCSFYGSQLWNLSSSSFNDICTAWNKAVRRIFHLPFTTHRFLLPCVTQSEHIRDNLIKRSTTLFQNMMLSDNEVIKCLSVNAYFCNSPVGLNRKFFNVYQNRALSEEEEGLSGLLLSLLKTRENHWCIPQFDIDEINEMIYHMYLVNMNCNAWVIVHIYLFIHCFFWLNPHLYIFLCTAGTYMSE